MHKLSRDLPRHYRTVHAAASKCRASLARLNLPQQFRPTVLCANRAPTGRFSFASIRASGISRLTRHVSTLSRGTRTALFRSLHRKDRVSGRRAGTVPPGQSIAIVEHRSGRARPAFERVSAQMGGHEKARPLDRGGRRICGSARRLLQVGRNAFGRLVWPGRRRREERLRLAG